MTLTGKMGTLLIAGTMALQGVTSLYAEDLEDKVRQNPGLSYFADAAGNLNGHLDDRESGYMGAKLEEGKEFYMLAIGTDKNSISFFDGPSKIYTSEKNLRKDWEGAGIKGLVNVIRFDDEGQITGTWLTGGYISDNIWKEIDIPKIDYEKSMANRVGLIDY